MVRCSTRWACCSRLACLLKLGAPPWQAQTMIELVLATDMKQHFKIVGALNAVRPE